MKKVKLSELKASTLQKFGVMIKNDKRFKKAFDDAVDKLYLSHKKAGIKGTRQDAKMLMRVRLIKKMSGGTFK